MVLFKLCRSVLSVKPFLVLVVVMYGLLWPNQWSNPEQLGPARGTVHARLEIELLVRDKIRLLFP
jgi:hypothetical protein